MEFQLPVKYPISAIANLSIIIIQLILANLLKIFCFVDLFGVETDIYK